MRTILVFLADPRVSQLGEIVRGDLTYIWASSLCLSFAFLGPLNQPVYWSGDIRVCTVNSAISRFGISDIDDMPEDIREKILAVQEKSGFVPNVFLMLAHRVDEFRAFFAYHDALMEKAGSLTKAEREMIVVATSSLNQCLYCVVAHGAILRIRTKNPLIADQIAVNYRKADISLRQKSMIDFAVKVSQHAYLVSDNDIEALRVHGFSEEDVWDIAAISSFFGMSNRLANVANMRPNEEFYNLGR